MPNLDLSTLQIKPIMSAALLYLNARSQLLGSFDPSETKRLFHSQTITKLVEPEQAAEQLPQDHLRVPIDTRRFCCSPFTNDGAKVAITGRSRAKKGALLTRDLRMMLQTVEAWVLDPDTSGAIFPKLERDMIKNLQLVVGILADWHLSIEAGSPFWMARRGSGIRERHVV